MKKIVASILALTLTFGTVGLPALENGSKFLNTSIAVSAETYGDYIYDVLDDGTVKISDYEGYGGNVIIPSTINNKTVSVIGEYAFGSDSNIVNITIPEGVSKIDYRAFSGCSNLNSITLPESITYIGGRTFEYCKSLTDITIPKNITFIKDYTFDNCSSLKNIKFSDNIIGIGEYAFNECTSLETLTLPSKLKTIEDAAFCGCLSLSKVIFPNSLTSIDQNAFLGCDNLKAITIPKSVTSIDTNRPFGYGSSSDKIIGFKIRCYKNSAAQKYAEDNKFAYYLIDHNHTPAYKITKKPTLTQTGTMVGKCTYSDCDKTITKVIPKLINISKAKISGLSNVSTAKPAVKVTIGSKILKNGLDYTVKYGTIKNGKATITLTGKGSYGGSVTKSFTVKTVISVKSSAKGKITATISKNCNASKYQIQYSSNANFKGAKTITSKTSKSSLRATSKKTYYVRARIVNTVGGKNYTSNWSASKKVTVK